MTATQPENMFLSRAREAARKNSLAATHSYYCAALLQTPESGIILTEYLQSARGTLKSPRQVVDIVAEGALSRLMPAQPPMKLLESLLEKLRPNPYDLDTLFKIGKCAQSAGHNSLAAAAFADVLAQSPTARIAAHKLTRELKVLLGKAYYQTEEFELCLKTLSEFQRDADASKETLQMLKDAAAQIASASFKNNEGSHKLATTTSIELATQTPQQKADKELAEVESQLNESIEPAKLVTAALRAADLHRHSGNFESALTTLAQVRARIGANADIERELIEIEVAKRECALNTLQARIQHEPELSAWISEQANELDEFSIQAINAFFAKHAGDGEMRLKLAAALASKWRRTREEQLLRVAVTHLQLEFKVDEQMSRAQLLLAECFMGLGLPAAAEIVLNDLLERLGTSRKTSEHYLQAQYLLGAVHEQGSDVKSAIRAYTSVVGRNINYRDAFQRLKNLNKQLVASK